MDYIFIYKIESQSVENRRIDNYNDVIAFKITYKVFFVGGENPFTVFPILFLIL